ncbi:TPA: hypothetical protein ACUSXA_000146 [Escherichia coli]|uniref:hypothetical protein n=1 Tax=Escherichia coli TaxID=562 RepID=UPI00128F04E7|nr:hypothetical protein [Escherichia coli]EFJ2771262.1 hypothetical protein [Escherichia coli]MQI20396.1 hypothetical protein [Escherichia coli]MQI34574.1 hypothetical protein [Escherichia coli]MQI49507.1 hypothetical protein [Escherichia coli]MQJ09162.1 hypothetical protein [Escherichia coli]
MNMHDRLRIVFAEARQFWWAFAYVMHLHENRYKKRAGVAGIRARATGLNGENPAQSPVR